MVDTSDEWIVTRTGIKERRICADNEASSDLGVRAARRAIEDAKISQTDIDLIIVCTITGDMIFPATACVVQEKLGIDDIPCFDLVAACSGFIYGLEVAHGLISAGIYKTILVIASECMSRLTDYTDRTTCVLLGDGAVAAVVARCQDGAGIIDSVLGAAGKYGLLLYVPAGGSKMPASPETVKNRLHFMKMEGAALFRIAVTAMASAVQAICKRNNLTPDDISLLIPHQANIRIIQSVARMLNFPMEKVFVNIEKYGNMSAASVGVALDEAVKSGRVRNGDIVCMVSFGAGLTWAANLIRWETNG
jgi:3-oxoacyl-[acyl-carrier-protein] synthase-3